MSAIVYNIHFKSFDMTNREVVLSFPLSTYRHNGANIDEDMVPYLLNIICNEFGYRFKLQTTVLGGETEPVQVRIVGFDQCDDIAIIEATHENAMTC
jgi:hypothetical protein